MRRLLIANRGEIARRIRATASELGIETVAVYTRAERDAPFVAECDRAYLLEGEGPGPYLDVAKLVGAARATNSDSVHPGYGFLAENAGFAQAVVDAGLVWVGPPADRIARMGDKLESKRVAREAGVPTLEPMDGGDVSFPALVKAAAGGGGKGMRVVNAADELDAAIAAAQREAERSFGDGTIFIEPFLLKARHVEIQVLGDAHGNLMHLFERECSIQRRHQKVVEEAPSVAVDSDLRARMGDAAVALASAIGYRNAGTVEFLLGDDGRFFFMEMNTRLQVEHPVTEEVTGIDLVEQQLLDADGQSVTASPPAEPIGHAIEVRLNSEDPSNDFLPATGTLIGWSESAEPAVRVDSGVEQGSIVTTTFDPLIAKFISYGDTRSEAASRLALALERAVIQGVETNRDLLVALLRTDAFVAGDTTTDFLERVSIPPRRMLTDDERREAITRAVFVAESVSRSTARVLTTFPSGWRNSVMPPQRRTFEVDSGPITVDYTMDPDGTCNIAFGDGEPAARVPTGTEDVRARYRVGIGRPGNVDAQEVEWFVGGMRVVENPRFPSTGGTDEVSGSLHAPMPGSVVSVDVGVGETVRKGQTLVVLEAMKMEHPIASPNDGVVSQINVAAGDQVERGTLLVVVEES